MNTTTASSAGIGDLLRQLRDDTTRLVREEVALAKAETTEKLPRISRNVAFLAGGALIAYSALVLVLLSFAWALRELFVSRGMSEGLSMFLGLLIVGAIVGGLSATLITKGISGLKGTSLAPEKTVRTLKEDKDWVQTKITT
jgi:hypothetical protein